MKTSVVLPEAATVPNAESIAKKEEVGITAKKENPRMEMSKNKKQIFHTVAQSLLTCFLLLFVFQVTGSAQADDDRQLYEQGKLYFKQKLYHDAKKAFLRVSKTSQGKQSFRVHYYLARSMYQTGDIAGAITTLQRAKELMKTGEHRDAYQRFASKILALYGKLVLVPEVDPDEVGRLRIVLTPKATMSNPEQRNFFNSVMGQIKRQGGLKIGSQPIFLPKGDYEISIEREQCLKIGFFEGEKVATDISIGDNDVTLNVKPKRSCDCPSNQKIVQEGKKLYCACAKGTGWNKDKKICEVVGQVNPWPWVITGIGVVVVGGTIATIVAVTQNDGRRSFQLTGPGSGQVQLWK